MPTPLGRSLPNGAADHDSTPKRSCSTARPASTDSQQLSPNAPTGMNPKPRPTSQRQTPTHGERRRVCQRIGRMTTPHTWVNPKEFEGLGGRSLQIAMSPKWGFSPKWSVLGWSVIRNPGDPASAGRLGLATTLVTQLSAKPRIEIQRSRTMKLDRKTQ